MLLADQDSQVIADVAPRGVSQVRTAIDVLWGDSYAGLFVICGRATEYALRIQSEYRDNRNF